MDVPKDLFLMIIGKLAWMEKKDLRSYMAGVETAMVIAPVQIEHGAEYPYTNHWSCFSHPDSLTVEGAVAFMREKFSDDPKWFLDDFLVHPEYLTENPGMYSRGVMETVPVLFEVYRYLVKNFNREIVNTIWSDYLRDLKNRLPYY